MAYTQDMILEELRRIKEHKGRKTYMEPKQYQDFLPETLGYQAPDTSMRFHHLDQERAKNRNATLLEETRAQNRANYNLMKRRQQEMRVSRQNLKKAQRSKPAPIRLNMPSGGGGGHKGHNHGKSIGGRSVEQSGNMKVGVGQYLTTVKWRNHRFTVNQYAAPRFIGLLNALYQRGYRPVSIGGYSNRNIAGTNQKSLHAYGLAIDIDPHKNPVQYGSNRHALPPRVGALAAKYGLAWGGNWKSYKDPMHFSVPYGGRQ